MSISDARQDYIPTPNAKLLTSFIMHIAEDPSRIFGNKSVKHVPIIMTGNSFSTMYGPMMRHGRCCYFEWSPTMEEKRAIVESMLFDLVPDKHQVRSLLKKFSAEPVSFFSDVRSAVYTRRIGRVLELLAEPLGAKKLGEVNRDELSVIFGSNLDRITDQETVDLHLIAQLLIEAKRFQPK